MSAKAGHKAATAAQLQRILARDYRPRCMATTTTTTTKTTAGTGASSPRAFNGRRVNVVRKRRRGISGAEGAQAAQFFNPFIPLTGGAASQTHSKLQAVRSFVPFEVYRRVGAEPRTPMRQLRSSCSGTQQPPTSDHEMMNR